MWLWPEICLDLHNVPSKSLLLQLLLDFLPLLCFLKFLNSPKVTHAQCPPMHINLKIKAFLLPFCSRLNLALVQLIAVSRALF